MTARAPGRRQSIDGAILHSYDLAVAENKHSELSKQLLNGKLLSAGLCVTWSAEVV